MPKRHVILIVDDTPENLQVLGNMLEQEGHEVLVATNGAMALSVARTPPCPELILLDIMMPGMDGYEVCQRLKADPRTVGIPVIFVSGLHETIDKVTAFQAGGVDYVTKPFQAEEVLARVRTHLELCRQREELLQANRELRRSLAAEELSNRALIELNEKLRNSEALKSRFLVTMRRELDNPLSAIRALAGQIMAAGSVPDPVVSLAGEIDSAAFALDFQLRNICAAADLEAGEAEPRIIPVDLPALIREVVQSFTEAARAHGVTVRVDAPGPDGEFFPSDLEKLRLILANLLANAIKFTPVSGQVWLRWRNEAESLTLEVEDEGPGVPEESRTRIFERFSQLPPGAPPGPMGNGLGLAVVKALLDLLAGEICLAPGSIGGARFTVCLPRFQSVVEAIDNGGNVVER